MLTLAEALNQAAHAISEASDTPDLDARLLLQHALQCTHEALIARAQEPLDATEEKTFQALIARRATHEPIAYILGYRDFWRDRFLVTRATLIPRPDSETMIEALLKHMPDKHAALRVLDLGTGSGCLLLSALREYPYAVGLGVDISLPALTVARENARLLTLEQRAAFMVSDWCNALGSHAMFDVVLCNPPYIAADAMDGLSETVRDYEPRQALTDESDGINFYRMLFECLPKHMHSGSVGLFEVGDAQAMLVSRLAEKKGFQTLTIEHDIAGIARIVCVRRNQ